MICTLGLLFERVTAVQPKLHARLGRRLSIAFGLAISTSAIAAQPVAAIGPVTVHLESTRVLPAQPASAGSSLLEATRVSRWVFDSGDNRRMPYVIVDKINARVFAYDASGRLQGSAPVLLGLTRGDRVAQGMGDRQLSAIGPENRITPAGRFVSSLDHDMHGKEILLIDYAESIALHAVVKGTPQERRAQRLSSPTSADNRISYGCINVPLAFYQGVISPMFQRTSGVVYILPEMQGASPMFGRGEGGSASTARISAQP